MSLSITKDIHIYNNPFIDIDKYYPSSEYVISLKHSKLIPYWVFKTFNNIYYDEVNSDELYIHLPTCDLYVTKISTAQIVRILDETSQSIRTNSKYVLVAIGGTKYPIFIKNHIIYTYNILEIKELQDKKDLKPIILVCLCGSRDQKLKEKFDLNKAVLLVNSNPVDQHLMKPFNKYIKLYKELGVKNVLYTQTPEYYLFNNSIEKTPLMRKDKMEEYIEEFLPVIPQEIDYPF